MPPISLRLSALGRVALLALVPVLALACDDSAEREVTATPAPETPPRPLLPRITWLDAHSEVAPEQWLASRAADADLAETDPQVDAMRTELMTAARRFGDSPRMIANRAVQLEEMLAERGIEETAPELIGLLSSAASESRPKEGFGSVCQHYFILRRQGVGRDAALDRLRETSSLRPQHAQEIEAS